MEPHEIAASIRTRAELARRLSTEIKEPKAAATLREIARDLFEEADRLERVTTKQSLNET
jgi:hypothetical protein